ncbi:phosphatidylinositol-glycan biosynthesis class S protein [Paraphysoderma sedebokerense]|nr:phosphatidylinositol-glycan biosynthesis class S protein [Paraphysoderma sedebokerense]
MAQDPARRRILLSYILSLLLGLPVWWYSLSVYKAPLPFQQLQHYHALNHLNIPIHLHLHHHAEFSDLKSKFSNLPSVVSSQILQNVKNLENKYNVQLSFSTSVSQLSDKFDLPDTLALDAEQPEPGLEYDLYLFPDNEKFSKDKDDFGNPDVLVSKGKGMVVWGSKSTILTHVTDAMVYIFSKQMERLLISSSENERNNDIQSIRTAKYSPGYEITFSLLNADPKNHNLEWNIQGALEYSIIPFLNSLADVAEFKVNSQIQYYTTLTNPPKFKNLTEDGGKSGETGYHYLTSEDLPHFVNSAEWNLVSALSNYTQLNFLLYVPSAQYTPLKILNSRGDVLETNAFSVPRWGGVVIYNVEEGRKQVKLMKATDVWLTQLRGLVGIPEGLQGIVETKKTTLHFLPNPQTGLTYLESSIYSLTKTYLNLIHTHSTLLSLTTTFHSLPNMIIQDSVSEKFQQSFQFLKASVSNLSSSNSLKPALRHSAVAIHLAETAFFDESIISMLYFPDEHKIAVYMPFFVPVGVTLLASVIRELKSWKENRKSAALIGNRGKSKME